MSGELDLVGANIQEMRGLSSIGKNLILTIGKGLTDALRVCISDN